MPILDSKLDENKQKIISLGIDQRVIPKVQNAVEQGGLISNPGGIDGSTSSPLIPAVKKDDIGGIDFSGTMPATTQAPIISPQSNLGVSPNEILRFARNDKINRIASSSLKNAPRDDTIRVE